MYRFLVNPRQPQYQVTGHEGMLSGKQSPTLAESSDMSLQLKPAKGLPSPARQTPSRTESSEKPLSIHHFGDVHVDIKAPAPLVRPSFAPSDALDEAIEEAKAVQDLVSIFHNHSLTRTDWYEATRSG